MAGKKSKTTAKRSYIWVKQIRDSLVWITSCFTHRSEAMAKVYYTILHSSILEVVTIVTDASPSGLGGLLITNGVVQEGTST